MKKCNHCTVFATAITLLLAGCTVGPDYHGVEPSADSELTWRQNGSHRSMGDSVVDTETRWWERFEDPELDRLVAEALAGNFDLAQAAARVQAAYAQRGVTNADSMPQLSAGGAYEAIGLGKRAPHFMPTNSSEDFQILGAGAIATWEVDLWGRVKRLVQAADANTEAAIDAYHGVAIALASETALAYIDIRTLDARIEALDRNIDLLQRSLKLSEERFASGQGSQSDTEDARRQLEVSAAMRPSLVQARRQAQNRLAILLGKLPQDGLLASDENQLVLPQIDGLGLPADLLTRRPDVRVAERQYAAAMANIGAAEASRWPRLTLAGSFALVADKPSNYFNPQSFVYSIGPSLQVPLFEGNRIESNIAVSKSEAEVSRWELEQTLIEAVGEVDNAASGVIQAQARTERLQSAYNAARRSVLFIQQRYDSGQVSLFELIYAQQKLIEAEDSLLVARQLCFDETVHLYRALGGGWAAMETMRPVSAQPANPHLTLIEPVSETSHEN